MPKILATKGLSYFIGDLNKLLEMGNISSLKYLVKIYVEEISYQLPRNFIRLISSC